MWKLESQLREAAFISLRTAYMFFVSRVHSVNTIADTWEEIDQIENNQ